MAAAFWQSEHRLPVKLHNTIYDLIKRVKGERVVLYNVLDLKKIPRYFGATKVGNVYQLDSGTDSNSFTTEKFSIYSEGQDMTEREFWKAHFASDL